MDNYINVPGIGSGVVSCQPHVELTFKVDNRDLRLWWECTVLTQRYGLDPNSFGGMIAWAMELYERGIIDERDTDGIPMEWGHSQAIKGMLEKVANREGFGAILAENAYRAAEKVGRDSLQYLMNVKGMPIYQLNQINYRGYALAAAVGNRGDLVRGIPAPETEVIYARRIAKSDEEYQSLTEDIARLAERVAGTQAAIEETSYEGKAALVKAVEDEVAAADSLGSCKRHTFWANMPITREFGARLLTAGSGRQWELDDLLKFGEKMVTLERAYNARHAITRAQDTLPSRFFNTEYPGIFAGDKLDREKFEGMKDEYYHLRLWDVKTGIPGRACLESQGLASVAEDLNAIGKLPQEEALHVELSLPS